MFQPYTRSKRFAFRVFPWRISQRNVRMAGFLQDTRKGDAVLLSQLGCSRMWWWLWVVLAEPSSPGRGWHLLQGWEPAQEGGWRETPPKSRSGALPRTRVREQGVIDELQCLLMKHPFELRILEGIMVFRCRNHFVLTGFLGSDTVFVQVQKQHLEHLQALLWVLVGLNLQLLVFPSFLQGNSSRLPFQKSETLNLKQKSFHLEMWISIQWLKDKFVSNLLRKCVF